MRAVQLLQAKNISLLSIHVQPAYTKLSFMGAFEL